MLKSTLRKVTSLVLLAAALSFTLLKLLNHRIATHAYAPHLTFNSQPAPDLAFRTLDNQPRRLSDLRGKVVLVNLWGTWCLPCVAEMPTLQRLYNRFRNDPKIVFLIIASNDTPSQVRAFAANHHLDLPLYLADDADDLLTNQFQQYPSTSLYAKDGNLAATHTGPADWSDPTVIGYLEDLERR